MDFLKEFVICAFMVLFDLLGMQNVTAKSKNWEHKKVVIAECTQITLHTHLAIQT